MTSTMAHYKECVEQWWTDCDLHPEVECYKWHCDCGEIDYDCEEGQEKMRKENKMMVTELCAWCDEPNLSEYANPNAGDLCLDCCPII